MKPINAQAMRLVAIAAICLLNSVPHMKAAFIQVKDIYTSGASEQQQHRRFARAVQKIINGVRNSPRTNQHRRHNTRIAEQLLPKVQQAKGIMLQSTEGQRLLGNLEGTLQTIIRRAKQQPMTQFWSGIDTPLKQLQTMQAAAEGAGSKSSFKPYVPPTYYPGAYQEPQPEPTPAFKPYVPPTDYPGAYQEPQPEPTPAFKPYVPPTDYPGAYQEPQPEPTPARSEAKADEGVAFEKSAFDAHAIYGSAKSEREKHKKFIHDVRQLISGKERLGTEYNVQLARFLLEQATNARGLIARGTDSENVFVAVLRSLQQATQPEAVNRWTDVDKQLTALSRAAFRDEQQEQQRGAEARKAEAERARAEQEAQRERMGAPKAEGNAHMIYYKFEEGTPEGQADEMYFNPILKDFFDKLPNDMKNNYRAGTLSEKAKRDYFTHSIRERIQYAQRVGDPYSSALLKNLQQETAQTLASFLQQHRTSPLKKQFRALVTKVRAADKLPLNQRWTEIIEALNQLR